MCPRLLGGGGTRSTVDSTVISGGVHDVSCSAARQRTPRETPFAGPSNYLFIFLITIRCFSWADSICCARESARDAWVTLRGAISRRERDGESDRLRES